MPRLPPRLPAALAAAALLAGAGLPACARAATRVVAASGAPVLATALAVAPGGPAAVAAWVRREPGGPVLEATVRGPDGAWSAVQRLGAVAQPGAGDHRLTAAVAAGGGAVVAWAGTRPSARRPPPRFLRGVVLGADGRPATPLTALDPAGRGATLAGGRAMPAIGPDGAALVSWVEGGPPALAAAVRRPGAPGFGPARRARLGRAASPVGAAAPPGGRFVVLTVEGTRAGYRRVDRAAGIARPARLPLRRAARGRTALALGPDGGAVVAWVRLVRRGAGRVWAAARDAQGGWTAPRPVSGAPAPVTTLAPRVAAGGAGAIHVAWIRARGARPAAGVRGAVLLVSRDTGGWSPARTISRAGREATALRLAAGPDGTAMAAWAERLPATGWTAGTVRAVPGPRPGLDLVEGLGPAASPTAAGAATLALAVGGPGVAAAVPGRGADAAESGLLALTPARGARWTPGPLLPGGPPVRPAQLAVTGDGVPVVVAPAGADPLYAEADGRVVVLEAGPG